MADIYSWSTTAASNATADSSINWAEQQGPSTVNNSAREMMKRVAELLDDLGAVGTVGGTANALTLTSAQDSLATGKLIAFKAASANTGAATLNVNSLGAKAIRLNGDTALAANTIIANGIYVCRYDTAYNSSAGAWVLLTPESYKPGGTDVAVADGGTGASTAAAAATNLGLGTGDGPSFATVTLTAGSSGRAVIINETDGYLQLARAGTEKWAIGNEGSAGDRLAIWDAAGAAYRVILTSGTTQFLIGGTVQGYFHSNGLHIKQGSGSPAFGVDAGTQLLTDGSVFATKFNNPAIEITRGTTDGAQVQFYRGSATVVGNITTTATNTAYNTSSDERLKALFRDFDAGAIIDQMTMYEYEWKADGSIGYGPRAQELHAVFPLAVAPGNDKEPGEEGFEPWQWLGNPLVALCLKEIQSLRKRLSRLEG